MWDESRKWLSSTVYFTWINPFRPKNICSTMTCCATLLALGRESWKIQLDIFNLIWKNSSCNCVCIGVGKFMQRYEALCSTAYIFQRQRLNLWTCIYRRSWRVTWEFLIEITKNYGSNSLKIERGDKCWANLVFYSYSWSWKAQIVKQLIVKKSVATEKQDYSQDGNERRVVALNCHADI